MRSDTVTFVACAADPDADPDELGRFHALAQRLGALDGYPSHAAPGEVSWSCGLSASAIQAAVALLEACPRARAALTLGAPSLTLSPPDGPPLAFGPGAARARATAASLEPGVVHLSDALRGALGDLEPTSLGLTPSPTPGAFVRSPDHASAAARDVLARWDDASAEARADAIVGLVERAIDELVGGQPLHLLPLVHAHVERVVEVAIETRARDPEACARLLLALGQWIDPVWMRPELVAACGALVDASPLGSSPPADLERRLALHTLRAGQLSRLGELDRLDALLDGILEAAHGHPNYQARALIERAYTGLARQDPPAVSEAVARALSLLDDAPSRERVLAHKILGVLAATSSHEEHTSQERRALALSHLERAYALAQACGDRQLVMLVAGEWADVLAAADPERAAARMTEVLELARALHVDHFVAVAMSSLIELAILRGRWREAHELIARSRESLDAHDLLARWHVLQQEALVLLYEREYDRAAALTQELRDGMGVCWHPQVEQAVHLLELYGAVMSGHLAEFRRLLGRVPIEGAALLEPPEALADVLEAQGDDLPPALDRLSDALARADAQGEATAWTDLIWRHAIAHHPERFAPDHRRPCVAVGPGGAWLVNADGARIELAHRPYLHRLLDAFADLHERDDGGTLDTHTLFEHGWPGETVAFEAMKNRVYVAISKLRGFGLKPWLVSGPDGYYLSPELLVVRSPHTR